MEFTTYIIRFEANPDKSVKWFFYVAVGGIMGAVGAVVIGLNILATLLFLGTLAFVLIVAMVKKGNIGLDILSAKEKLVITSNGISIAGKNCDINDIKDLRFQINSYRGARSSRKGLDISDGIENFLSFNYNGKEVKYRFYLNSAKHTQILGQVFEEFYRKKIPFIETDANGYQTWLFRRLDEKELAAFKEKYS